MSQQTGNLSSTERAVSALCGLSFSLLAMRRGHPLWRLLTGVAGAALLSRSYAGHCGMKAALTGQASLGEGLSEQWNRMVRPPASGEGGMRRRGGWDAVDAAVDDSFPASDPPASRLADVPPANAAAKWAAARAAGEPPDA